jgi:rare lipoprotein A
MSTEVRINDRGPFVEGRIIDLSHAAAVAIGMIGPGVAHVKLTINGLPAAPEPPVFAVQTGAFANRENADRLLAHMAARYGSAALRFRAGTPPLWRLLVGKEPSTSAAETLARQIREEQSIPEAFVVRLDPGQGVD